MISIIVPIYNVEMYLEICLDSIIGQNYNEFEVIGVDDCSTDKSQEIFRSYASADDRFRYLKHNINLGLPSARNTGIFNALGDYLFFLDSDDWIAPNALKNLLDLIENDNVDIAMGGVLKCEEDTGRVFVPLNHAKYLEKDLHCVNIFTYFPLFFSVISCNKLIRKHIVYDNNLFFSPKPRRFEDMLTYKWYLSGASVSISRDITYFYRQRSNKSDNYSITQDHSFDSLIDRILAFADILEYIIKMQLLNTEYDPLHSRHAMMNLPRALEWIIPDIIKKIQIDDKEFFKNATIACNALKKLFSLFPDYSHIESWSDSLKANYQYIMQYNVGEAGLENCGSSEECV